MKVLLPIDGSELAMEAVRCVRSLADLNSVDAVVVTVSYNPVHYSYQPWLPEWTKQESDRTQAILDQAKQTLDESCRSVELVHGSGATVPFILNQAEKSDVDLIVLGAKGHSALSRILLGSISDSIASHAKCSVLVVRPSGTHAGRLDRVFFAYDKSVASREAAAELMEWKLQRDTQMEVISIVHNPYVFLGEGYMAEPITVSPQQVKPVSENAERMASEIAERFPRTKSQTVVADHIGDAIVRAAEKGKADLIVVGDTGHSVLGEFFLGSTSKYVLRHAPCSVWISRHHYKSNEPASEHSDAIATT